MEKKLIITADDYGMCIPVDQAIDDCINAELLTSTNVIVNMDDFEAAKTVRKRFPQISIGLHWNVTAGKPVSDVSKVRSLVDPNTGNFWKLPQFLKLFHNGNIVKKELREELIAQYDRFCQFCGKPDYWNTHQNSSVDFKTNKFFNSLALELGINKTRSQRRVYASQKYPEGSLLVKIKEVLKRCVLDIWFGYQIPKSGTKMPQGRVLYFNLKDKTKDIKNVGENICWGKKNIIEMVIHPANKDQHPYFGTITTERVDEWKMFTDSKTKDYFNRIGVKLVTFEALD